MDETRSGACDICQYKNSARYERCDYIGQPPLDPVLSGRGVITADDSPVVRMSTEIADRILNILRG